MSTETGSSLQPDPALRIAARVVSSSIVQGSGDASFDEAALAMVRRSDPVPKPPVVVVQEGVSFTLPVLFRAKRGG
jgi:protein TonB